MKKKYIIILIAMMLGGCMKVEKELTQEEKYNQEAKMAKDNELSNNPMKIKYNSIMNQICANTLNLDLMTVEKNGKKISTIIVLKTTDQDKIDRMNYVIEILSGTNPNFTVDQINENPNYYSSIMANYIKDVMNLNYYTSGMESVIRDITIDYLHGDLSKENFDRVAKENISYLTPCLPED